MRRKSVTVFLKLTCVGLAEEERIRQEQLEAKQRAIEEEKRRVEEEKRRLAEEKRLAEERARLNEEQVAVDERNDAMRQNAEFAKKARYRPLDDKYLACNPLPDPANERDLTTFITLWREEADKTLLDAVNHCQIAENVITEMQNISGEALAMYD